MSSQEALQLVIEKGWGRWPLGVKVEHWNVLMREREFTAALVALSRLHVLISKQGEVRNDHLQAHMERLGFCYMEISDGRAVSGINILAQKGRSRKKKEVLEGKSIEENA